MADETDFSEHLFNDIYGMEKYLSVFLFYSLFQKIAYQSIAEGLSKRILDQLDIIIQGNGQKLIAQTSNGANVLMIMGLCTW